MNAAIQAVCDAAQAKAQASLSDLAAGHAGAILLCTILASSLSFIDGSVVNVGLPAIGSSLHGDAADLQWAINAYLLPLSALLMLGGAAGDRFGRVRILVGGTVLFAAASALCARAPAASLTARRWAWWGMAAMPSPEYPSRAGNGRSMRFIRRSKPHS